MVKGLIFVRLLPRIPLTTVQYHKQRYQSIIVFFTNVIRLIKNKIKYNKMHELFHHELTGPYKMFAYYIHILNPSI